MKPTECPACGGDQLHHDRLRMGGFRFGWRCVPVTAAACLGCGVVTTYLDDWALDQMRKANGMVAKAGAKGEPGDDF